MKQVWASRADDIPAVKTVPHGGLPLAGGTDETIAASFCRAKGRAEACGRLFDG